MTPAESNVFLTKAAQLDPRMKRVDLEDQADMAQMWSLLMLDVPLSSALSALVVHYRHSVVPIMPAHVVEILGIVKDEPLLVPDLDPAWLLETKRTALAEFGYTAEQYDSDPKVQADVAARWSQRVIEGPVA